MTQPTDLVVVNHRQVSSTVVAALSALAGCLLVVAAIIFARAIADTPPTQMIDVWEIDVVADAPIVLEDAATVPLSGLFQCSAAALSADPVVQFSSSIRAVDRSWEVRREQLPPRRIVGSCNQTDAPVEFGSALTEQLVRDLSVVVTEPTEVVMLFSVSGSPEWVAADTTSSSFVLEPPSPGPASTGD